MCGILAALGLSGDPEKNRREILKLSKLLRHRGPDQSAIYQSEKGDSFIAFERLMIVDPTDTGRYVAFFIHVLGTLLYGFRSSIMAFLSF